MRLLRHPHFLAVSLSHWMVDLLGAQTGILLAVLSDPLGLTNADIGLIATAYTCITSLAQPLFGWLADRYGSRWSMIGGVLWMGFFFSLVAVTPGTWPLVFLVIGGLGSAAFHPSGTSRAIDLGHRRMAGQVATATSLFIVFGQGGLSVGPALGGLLLDHLGRPGLLGLTVLAVPIALFTAWQIRPEPRPLPGHTASHEAHHASPEASPDLTTFALVMIMASLRLWAQSAVNIFAPKYFHDLGLSPSVYGVIVALFMGGAAIGGVIGGMLSDRWNRRWTITLTLFLSVLPLYLLPVVQGGWVFPLALVAGLLSGAPHSIFIAMAQRSLPGRAALAAGITLGFMFASGAAGAYLSGLAADQFGLSPVLQANAGLTALAALLSLWLRSESPRLRPEPAPATARS
jgi:FSR family fosmidomycin resistance protein-like MFS transporter